MNISVPELSLVVMIGVSGAGKSTLARRLGAPHRDHRFEWTRAQFRTWAASVCARFGYGVEFCEVGERGTAADGREVGAPTQMGVFSRG